MSMIHWNPLRDRIAPRDNFDRMLDSFFEGALSPFSGAPSLDLYQTDDEIVVRATLPGVKAEDVDISIAGDTLTLRGEIKEEKENRSRTYHIQERRFGSFSRTIQLPVPIKVDEAKAEFENGVLTLTMPKAEEVRARTISVKAK